MTKHEFIGLLREALTGEIPESVIEENVRFYSRYIDEERSKGRREEDIFTELGDPRLIAKTITETWQSDDTSLDDDGQDYNRTYDSYGGDQGYGSYSENGSRSGDYRDESFININGHHFNMNKWYMKIIPVLIVVLIICFFLWVLFGLLHLTFSVLTSPVFWVIILVLMIISFLGRRR